MSKDDGQFYYVPVSGVQIDSVMRRQPVWAVVPRANRLLVTPTYAAQVLIGNSVLVEPASISKITEMVRPDVEQAVAGKRAGLEQKLAALAQQSGIDFGNMRGRLRPLLDYAAREGRDRDEAAVNRVAEGIGSPADMTRLLTVVYDTARRRFEKRNKKAFPLTSQQFKDEVGQFLNTGAFTEQLYGALVEIDGKFRMLSQYSDALSDLNEIQSLRLEDSVMKTVEGERDDGFGIEAAIETNIGKRIGNFFAMKVEKSGEGEVSGSAFAPARYSKEVPEELRDFYLPLPRLGRMMVLLDWALTFALAKYVANETISGFLDQLQEGLRNRAIFTSFLKRGLVPNNPLNDILWPDVMGVASIQPELARKTLDYVAADISGISKAAADMFETPEAEQAFPEAINLCLNLASLIPLQFFMCHNTMNGMGYGEQMIIERKVKLNPVQQNDFASYRKMKAQILQEFNLGLAQPVEITMETAADLVEFFGPQYAFASKAAEIRLAKQ